MEMVDKIIFNKLLAREALSLPNIGALVPKQTPAKLVGKSEVEPPQSRVVFSKNIDQIVSILDVISTQASVDSDQALEIYNTWLETATQQEGGYAIIGVGSISKDFFHIDQSFDALINPLAGKKVSVTKNTKKLPVTSIIAVATILVVIGVGYVIYDNITARRSQTPEIETIAWVAAEDDSTTTQKDTLTNSNNITTTENTVAPKSNYTNKEKSSNTYYLAVGVYSSNKNADEFIAKTKKSNKSVILTKVPYKRGTILVSAYSGSSFNIVEKYRQNLLTQFSGTWVYKEFK